MSPTPEASLDLAALIGLPTDEAVSRVEAAGLRPWVLDHGAIATMAWVADRVRLVVREGRVDNAIRG